MCGPSPHYQSLLQLHPAWRRTLPQHLESWTRQGVKHDHFNKIQKCSIFVGSGLQFMLFRHCLIYAWNFRLPVSQLTAESPPSDFFSPSICNKLNNEQFWICGILCCSLEMTSNLSLHVVGFNGFSPHKEQPSKTTFPSLWHAFIPNEGCMQEKHITLKVWKNIEICGVVRRGFYRCICWVNIWRTFMP